MNKNENINANLNKTDNLEASETPDMRVILNLMGVESRADARNIARAFLVNEFYEFLCSKFEGVRRTGLAEFAFPIAYVKDSDGFSKDIYGKVEFSIPNWWDVVGEKRQSKAFNPKNAQYDWENDLTTPKKLRKEAAILEKLDEYKEEVAHYDDLDLDDDFYDEDE